MPAKKTKPTLPTPFWKNKKFHQIGQWVVIPLSIYFLFFLIYTWPWMAHFSSHFFTDSGDGLQNIWNMWWVDKSVVDFQQLPWYTGYLHYPEGVTLVGQTLNPFNGFVGILLINIFHLSLVQAFNIMITFSFLMAGLTAFWLCYYFSKSYIGSIIGGFIFTFSSYHFAHAIGHMQLVSLEWIPLFILLWWCFVKKPSYKLALGSSVVLLLVVLCDYYYFLYSTVLAILIFIYLAYKKEIPNLKEKKTIFPFLSFLVSSLLLVAPLPFALLKLNAKEQLSGFHPSRQFSADIFTPFIDGGFWRFHTLTDWYWSHVPTFVAESSVYLGLSVLVLVIIALIKRTKINNYINFWLVIGFLFGILSLGPRLLVLGNTIERVPLPYALLEKIFPTLKLSGTPIRMMVIVGLSVAIISSLVLAKLNLSTKKGKVLIGIFCVVLILELWPSTLPLTSARAPAYVYELKKLPYGAVLDNGAKSEPLALYHQTFYEKPMALGYISRTPKSVENKDIPIVQAVLTQHYDQLCPLKIRYFTTPTYRPLGSQYKVVYKDKSTIIYDLKNSSNC